VGAEHLTDDEIAELFAAASDPPPHEPSDASVKTLGVALTKAMTVKRRLYVVPDKP
jgi:hypothetical protein